MSVLACHACGADQNGPWDLLDFYKTLIADAVLRLSRLSGRAHPGSPIPALRKHLRGEMKEAIKAHDCAFEVIIRQDLVRALDEERLLRREEAR